MKFHLYEHYPTPPAKMNGRELTTSKQNTHYWKTREWITCWCMEAYTDRDTKDDIFSNEEIENIAALVEALKQIRIRLLREINIDIIKLRDQDDT